MSTPCPISEEQMKILEELEKDLPQAEVQIDGAVNLKSSHISFFKVSLAYGDLTLIIAMIRDYIRTLDEQREQGTLPVNQVEYDAYYRGKFMAIADRISQQINYDYEKQLEICRKKLEKMDKQSNSDIGGDALELSMYRGR